MKWRRLFVAALALSLVAVACGGDEEGGGGTTGTGPATGGEPVTLDFWVFEEGGIGSFLETLEQDFEAEHPNVDLKITAYPEDNYGVKLDTAIAAGKEPDLVLVFGPEQMRAGLLLPLDDMIAEQGIDLSSYVPAIVQPGDEFSCAYEGKLYCMGSYAGSVQMLYNKDLFDAKGIPYPAPWPPMTPEQFVDIACQLTDEANGVWGGAASDPLAYLPFDMMWSADGRTAEGYVNGPDFVHQFEVLASGYDQGCIPSSNILDPWEQGRDFFAKGDLAMVITDFQDLNKVEEAGINYGSTGVPTPTGVTPYFFVWTDSVGVMANSDNPNEALDFIAFLTTKGQQIRYEVSGDIPLDLAVADEVNWAGDIPGRQDGLEILSHARPLVFVPNRWDVAGPYYDAWGFVLGGEKTAQEALDDAAPAIQENLDKAWKDWEEAA
ncbi:MAG TPA: sugar ABC transporter substrate-binding protein [Actinomycetota bacterium]|nr:sugar ABC transporter substrate-binding protein [Actinomycetota bacterium]